MRNIIVISFFILLFISNSVNAKVISNEKIDKQKVETASKIIAELQIGMPSYTKNGSGSFVAAIYDNNGNLIAKVANSVINIKAAEEKLKTYDLAPYNLKLYVTAEPCMMCIGGIMWSGIKEIYYSVPSKSVEEITGFDEGFKPYWFKELKKEELLYMET